HLGPCHPMFLLRLRMFVDWHAAAGRHVALVPPRAVRTRRLLADMTGTDDARRMGSPMEIPVRRLSDHLGVEELAGEAAEMVQMQTRSLAVWGGALHMAIGELCDNALQHGANSLGVYVAVGR